MYKGSLFTYFKSVLTSDLKQDFLEEGASSRGCLTSRTHQLNYFSEFLQKLHDSAPLHLLLNIYLV